MITTDLLAALREKALAATKGKWEFPAKESDAHALRELNHGHGECISDSGTSIGAGGGV